jgi:hypothetical protein
MVASNAAHKAAAAPALAYASAPQQDSLFGGLLRNVASACGAPGGKSEPARQRIEMARVAPDRPAAASLDAPLPPPRPADVASTDDAAAVEAADAAAGQGDAAPSEPVKITYAYGIGPAGLPKLIGGAQPILPARFVADAELFR